jgi:restriction system protein
LARGQGEYSAWNRQEALRLQRQSAAAEKAAERQRRLRETEEGKASAQQLNEDLTGQVGRLQSILRRGLEREAAIDLNTLVRRDELPPLDLVAHRVAAPPPVLSDYAPPEPGALAGFFGAKSRHEQRLAAARDDFERAKADYDRAEAARQEWVHEQTSRYEAALRAHDNEVARHNSRIAQIASGLRHRNRESVQWYLELALSRTLLPKEVPHMAELAYSSQGEQAVVRFELPLVEVIPAVDSYTYVATTSTLREKKRPKVEMAHLYRSVVSQITLLYMRDLFESDPELDNVELAGHVRSVNPGTGQWEYPCLISVATDRATYSTLNLHDVHPDVCLHHLSALVSHHPHLVEAVNPIRDFDLARYSFIENVDVVAGLDSRADLTKMSPTEFEHFVRQLFEASGLEGWTTQRSGDDGVDAVVINRDPLVGGLTIVQAKRYLAVIGISHIRELVGAMDEKGAGRGILVTTSWFTAGCWIKAEQNNRIELIDGPRLRHLVKEHLHMDVLVAPPAPRSHTWHP